MKTINITHLYPKEMNIYGDNGNLIVFTKRLQLRGYKYHVSNVGVGEKIPLNSHFILGGGGQDAGQSLIAKDLHSKRVIITNIANDKVPMLMICGMYQMFGHYFKPQNSSQLPGIGIFDCYTLAETGRLIGNIAVKTDWGEVVGYENHSGRTYLGANTAALGTTDKNCGNNGKDLLEGAVYNNVYGSYLHGPMLAKAPIFCDHLIELAITCAGINEPLTSLNDELEYAAAASAKMRNR